MIGCHDCGRDEKCRRIALAIKCSAARERVLIVSAAACMQQNKTSGKVELRKLDVDRMPAAPFFTIFDSRTTLPFELYVESVRRKYVCGYGKEKEKFQFLINKNQCLLRKTKKFALICSNG